MATDELLTRLVDACKVRYAKTVDDGLRDATSDFLNESLHDRAVLQSAARSIQQLLEVNPSGAAWLAITLGTIAEREGTAAITGPILWEHFQTWMTLLPALDGDDDTNAEMPEPTQGQSALLSAFPEFCQAIVAHIARMPEERRVLGENAELMDRLQELETYGPGATWVREALQKTSGRLLALYPHSQKGFSLKYENLSNCFHLFTLLQGAIGRRLPGGRRPNMPVLDIAKGKARPVGSDAAWWHYGDPQFSTPALTASIWGEASPRSIPSFDDVQVILLWPPLLKSRTWDTGFFCPHLAALPADAILERELSIVEVRAWMNRLDIKVPPKWWWPW